MNQASMVAESTPAGDGGSPRAFDFRDPGRATREGIRRLEAAHEDFATSVDRTLSAFTGSQVRMRLRSVGQMTRTAYVDGMPPSAQLCTLSMEPYTGHAVLEISAEAGLALVEVMLGGTAESVPRRRLTELELSLLEEVPDLVLGALTEELRPLGMTPEIVSRTTDPHAIVASGADALALLHYEISVGNTGDFRDRLVVAYPIEALLALVETQPRADFDPAAGSPILRKSIENVVVPLAVRTRATKVSFSDIATLQPGDVLRLDNAFDDPVVGVVGGVPLIEGLVGRGRKNLALQFSGWLNP